MYRHLVTTERIDVESDKFDNCTIRDFSEQWARLGSIDHDFFSSSEFFRNILGPSLSSDAFKGKRVGDIGSGNGRIVNLLLDAGAVHVVAVEPSSGVELLRKNLAGRGGRCEVLHASGEAIPGDASLDYVTAIGVMEFIRDPSRVVAAVREALRPGGGFLLHTFSKEALEPYLLLRMLTALRRVTTRMPHWALAGFCGILTLPLELWILLCRAGCPLPLRDCAVNVLGRVSRSQRWGVLYDFFNPSHVHYMTGGELRALLEDGGFVDVELHLRWDTWTAFGRRPAGDD